jgi:hypothetical protein
MVAAFKEVGLNVRIVPEPLRPDTEAVVESAPKIEPVNVPYEPTIPFIELLDNYQSPQVAAAPVPVILGGLSDEEMLRILEAKEVEISVVTRQITDEEFFGF